jgi:radical SAM superfamily enzyme YgiQ (UPF0313 family)
VLKDIILTTINAKWIHPSLALRLLKANLGDFEDRCEIIEFNLRQPLAEKLAFFFFFCSNILGVSVSIWNHTATLEFLAELEKVWKEHGVKPVVVLGGPEVSHLPESAEIFRYADYVIRGEGEIAFKVLCKKILSNEHQQINSSKFINAVNVDLNTIKSAYHLYTDEDLARKLIYIEASRGCIFNCDFCLSAVKEFAAHTPQVQVPQVHVPQVHVPQVREFPIESFIAEMNTLIRRGAKTFKFLDRSFNTNVKRAVHIMEFFLEKINDQKEKELMVHFEMIPSLFPPELREILTRFPQGTLRIEIGIQTLNNETASIINRHSNPEKELESIRFLREKTNAILHVDLIAGLPGENLESFGKGFDQLWLALSESKSGMKTDTEIQLGILKLLPGTPLSRHSEIYDMRYNPMPPYEIEETSVLNMDDLKRTKNFARFWEIIVNRGLVRFPVKEPVFYRFMELSDSLFVKFGRNWGINKEELLKSIKNVKYLEQLL